MGERVYVTLAVLKQQVPQIEDLLNSGAPDNEHESDDGMLWYVGYSEVNYGSLPFLKALQQRGVAYDSTWAAGSDWSEGTESCRFTPEGELEEKSVYLSDQGVSLFRLLDELENHQALKDLILEHKAKTAHLPLDEKQIEYGKLYQTKQLIAPD